ncbi:adenosylcobinamide-GDP ribazoletransferase [Kaistia dalseonensis]|uniref:Adenosylcobinamide-GDP ribazoletransferase n=1 Tax=Kaistia dalseonensis TaxID=410840 RepID=A0ABU0H2D0_9HYPH|nr:adenosylcobinamide-GDP ribazoletransferase [Kaistia dalseonensis]MCX5493877.1 adenosylcobinamide-GDP ribazoletransferase [Kaistia dalseonensis]MDQ0436442.1 adenosylcobinamide-GDP ribazoletransferase [Kaistia dalseonensis]
MAEPASFLQRTIVGREFLSATAFLTRLPAGFIGAPDEKPDFSSAARTFPLVGLLVGLIGALALLLADALRLPPLASALIGVAVTILLTGALHEDGLADTADGFGGGQTAVAKLDIMRDSRIGTFGAIALVLSIMLRVTLVAAFLPYAPWAAAVALMAAETVGRAAIVHAWSSLPSARFEGLAEATGRPGKDTTWAAVLIATVIGLAFGTIAAGPLAALVALAATALTTYAFESLCRRQIGGHTGDTLGAAEQAGAIAFLLGLVAFA